MSNSDRLAAIIKEPESSATASVIWLHGLGASGDDFANIVPLLQLPNGHSIRFIFPHAPSIPVSINANIVMPAWFNIFGLELDSPLDAEGMEQSCQRIRELIEAEIKQGVKPERIILAGFSQGGAVALHTGLRYPKTLAGVIGLSTFLPHADHLDEHVSPANMTTPILLAHGQADDLLKFEFGELSYQRLLCHGLTVDWKVYPHAHEVSVEQIRDIGQWLVSKLI